ncbi:hypothetical protein [Undibacterium rugosum]|uniref:hypothetical protein n=1 Tax=Undibacterium rugosum TaxID=2762291 RepID=UPI001B827608|nr:hypothetical protein [Undibacterium rugosum]MBR7780375.1 hypothetical protein [Undibacterium rugosum]
MEKIELNKRTLRTLSMSELELVAGASEDGDEDPDGAAKKPPKKSTIASECPCATELCPPKSKNCPPTADLKCCPNTGD